MLTPSNRSITVSAGGTALVGRTTAIGGGGGTPLPGMPAWRAGAVLGQWMEIPGTAGAGGALLTEFSSYVKVGTKVYAPLCSGHNQADNRTTMVDLGLDNPGTPGWTVLNPPSASSDWIANASYYADGKPSGRHLRFMAHYIPEYNAIITVGNRDPYGVGGAGFGACDYFDLSTNTWKPAGYLPSSPNGTNGGSFKTPNGKKIISTNGWVYDVDSRTWDSSGSGFWTVKPNDVRYPFATTDSYIFGLCWGDGWGYGSPVINAQRISPAGVAEVITFNASASRDQFIADGTGADIINEEAGMCWVPDGGYFIYACGIAGLRGDVGRYYKIIPNSGTVWDMQLMTFTGAVQPTGPEGGMQNRCQYFPELKGVVAKPKISDNLLFLPTA